MTSTMAAMACDDPDMATQPTPEQAAALAALAAAYRRRETARAALANAERDIEHRVAVCRRERVTWDEIAAELHAKQPNVHAKYAPLLAAAAVAGTAVPRDDQGEEGAGVGDE